MKFILKMLLSGAVGFAVSYITLELLYGKITGDSLESFYFWLGIIMIGLAVLLLIYAFVRRRQLLKLTKDENRKMNDDDFDIYKYNSFNVITISTSVPLVLSLMSLAIQTMTATNIWLVIVTVLLLFTATMMNLRASALVNIIYPDRNLPEVSDKNYNQKLLAASDEGELFIMTKALYSSWTLSTTMLFFALILMTIYSFITSESQIFSIIIIGFVMIINQLKYSYEIKEK